MGHGHRGGLERFGATLLLLDERTDSLDLAAAPAPRDALAGYDGTVLAVTHDRWFARSFDRYVVLRGDGTVSEVDKPGWDEPRVATRGGSASVISSAGRSAGSVGLGRVPWRGRCCCWTSTVR